MLYRQIEQPGQHGTAIGSLIREPDRAVVRLIGAPAIAHAIEEFRFSTGATRWCCETSTSGPGPPRLALGPNSFADNGFGRFVAGGFCGRTAICLFDDGNGPRIDSASSTPMASGNPMKRLATLWLVAGSLLLGTLTVGQPVGNHSASRPELADRLHQHFRTQRFFNRAARSYGAPQIVPRAPYNDSIDRGSRTPPRWRAIAG